VLVTDGSVEVKMAKVEIELSYARHVRRAIDI
jgi:hypothetical protein